MTPQERIKADAEDYALPMVWVNQNPKGEEQLFYEYISSTSYIAGATAEHDRAQVLVDALEWVKTYGPVDELTVKFIDKQLEQWKGGKEAVEGDVCTCSIQQLVAHGECHKCPGQHTRQKLTNPQK